MQTTNPVGQRRNNLAVLARAIWQNPGISRRELVDKFDIDESSVSRLVSQLLEVGLVEATGTIDNSGANGAPVKGRKRVALNIARNFGQVWGIALWRDRIRISITDTQGSPLGSREIPVETYPEDWAGYLLSALEYARAMAAEVGPRLPVLGIGFGVPGLIDTEASKVVQSDEFGLKDVVSPLALPGQLPVLWENDANCGALSGMGTSARSADEVFVLGRFLSHGPKGLDSEFAVGFGLVVGGQLHRGWRHYAGEFRSALWASGNRSAYGLDDEVYGRCATDDAAFHQLLTELLRNLRFMTHLLDPKVIHLGGDLKNHFQDLVDASVAIDWEEARDLLNPMPQFTDEVSRGAALLVLDELFQLPKDNRRTLFKGYGTGVNDPVWRGIPLKEVKHGVS